MNSPLKVLLTRSSDDNRDVARLFRTRGVESLSLPMIQIRDITPDLSLLPDPTERLTVLLTSRKATTKWLNLRHERREIADLKIRSHLIVGRRSASFLLAQNPNAEILCLSNSIEELLEDVLALYEKSKAISRYQNRTPLIYPCSLAHMAMASGFNEVGYRLHKLPLYEPILPEASIQKLPRSLEALDPEGTILFFSPSAVDHFFQALTENNMGVGDVEGFRFGAIGATTEEALNLKGIEGVMVADRPEVGRLVERVCTNTAQ